MGAILMWFLWNRRNDMVFNGKDTYHPVIIDRVYRLAADCNSYAKKIYGGVTKKSSSSPKTWKAPPEGTIKFNYDASLTVEGWVGLGVIARDWRGEILFAATLRVRAHWPPLIAEGKVAAMAIKLTKSHNLHDIIIEGNCQVLINKLSKALTFFTDLDNILDDILASCVSFNSVNW
ncbi:uncharacterized protein LOC110734694 [Chenopodium quinoa]|uniref:uncharacterized protein LOC110734694 n=1 Tax=Chenopodium quinoa TaxID=63459 RepID=UPI000B78E723|nr:uncharacterized protein LOC110734694 [Chenopodium quinoa]